MEKLISKLQYEFYEIGEFSDIAPRTLQETIVLVINFPWQDQNRSLGLGVSSPSVTIEGNAGSFLKIGIYYNNQFCLYLLTRRGKYYVRITETLEDVFILLKDYFEEKPIVPFFSREYDFRVKRHFVTKDFTYRVTLRRSVWVMLLPGLYSIPYLFFFCASFHVPVDAGIMAIIIITWLFFAGISWLLFINHFIFNWGKFITISAGQNNFTFGTRSNHKEYDKRSIKSITSYNWKRNGKGPPWTNFEVYEIVFADGSKIKFTSLLLSPFIFPGKFNMPIREVQAIFPFVWNCR